VIEEKQCYECGKMKTALNRNSRCLTCVTERSEFNQNENQGLRFELAETQVERGALVKKISLFKELISDDAHAFCFSTVNQYRKYLLNIINT